MLSQLTFFPARLFPENGWARKCLQSLSTLAKRIQEIAFNILKALFPCFFSDKQSEASIDLIESQLAELRRSEARNTQLQEEIENSRQRTRRIQAHAEIFQSALTRLEIVQASIASGRQLVCVAKTPDGHLIVDLERPVEPKILEQMQKALIPKLSEPLVRSFLAHTQALNQLAPGEATPAMPADIVNYIRQRLAEMRQQAETRLT